MRRCDVAFLGGRGIYSNYGGVENAVREISYEMGKTNGIKICVYGVNDESICKTELPKNIFSVGCSSWIPKFFGQHGAILSCVLHSIFILRPKVVIIFASGPCIFTPVLRLAGLKVVTSLRAIDSARDKWGLFSRTILKVGEYCSWKFSNVFTVNSKEMAEFFTPLCPNVVFIPNGAKVLEVKKINVFEKYDIPKTGYFLFAARLDPVKRLHLLLDAHKKLGDSIQVPLVIAGGHVKDPAYLDTLYQGASHNVKFLGHLGQSDLEVLLQGCRAFISPSILEGMSNSILSAMANGKPVLAADIQANSDVLQDERAMFIADDVNDLSENLRVFGTNDEFCSDLGSSLKKSADRHFSWASTAQKFFNLFESFL